MNASHLCFVKALFNLGLTLESLLVFLSLQPSRVYLSLNPCHHLHAVQCFLGLALNGEPLVDQQHQPSNSSFLVWSPCLQAKCLQVTGSLPDDSYRQPMEGKQMIDVNTYTRWPLQAAWILVAAMSSFERADHVVGEMTVGRAIAAAAMCGEVESTFEVGDASSAGRMHSPSSHLVSTNCTSAVISSKCCLLSGAGDCGN